LGASESGTDAFWSTGGSNIFCAFASDLVVLILAAAIAGDGGGEDTLGNGVDVIVATDVAAGTDGVDDGIFPIVLLDFDGRSIL
jgi:hypothetical protein